MTLARGALRSCHPEDSRPLWDCLGILLNFSHRREVRTQSCVLGRYKEQVGYLDLILSSIVYVEQKLVDGQFW